mmetsp:Transcript_22189/g.61797  ORF Transcript_22189/g.61797 Transcript_22189/m.61797 type:complete len:98 (+) Transcript_22189:375-668(+)
MCGWIEGIDFAPFWDNYQIRGRFPVSHFIVSALLGRLHGEATRRMLHVDEKMSHHYFREHVSSFFDVFHGKMTTTVWTDRNDRQQQRWPFPWPCQPE